MLEFSDFSIEGAFEQNPKWNQMIKREKSLYDVESDIRSDFQRDYTRVIYSNAYKRLKHKTQVFFAPTNDHICTRIEHVNYVESISYLIANELKLNTELTKTISVSHDLGHSPFGHKGEKVLNEILKNDTGKTFWHEKNGLEFVDNIELLEDRDGYKQNLNLTYAVRDGIISHCGEIDENSIKPRSQAIDLEEYQKPNQYNPYTWEGCVVKIADKISYVGRDIEDAIRFKILSQEDEKSLGEILNFKNNKYTMLNNTNIINFLIKDLLENSSLENGLAFSQTGLDLVNNIKKFNYEKIYENSKEKLADKYFKMVITTIYNVLKSGYSDKISDIANNENVRIYRNVVVAFVGWLKNYCKNKDFDEEIKLKNNKIYDITKKEDYCEAIIEYISGMTDNMAIDMFNEIIRF